MTRQARAPITLLTIKTVCLWLVYLANARNCPLITLEDLGSTTNFSDTGLISEAISTGDSTPNNPVQIIRFNVVCDATGERKSTSNYVSVLVEYVCSGGVLAECDGMNRLTKQFQLQCSDQTMYTSTVFGTQTFAVTDMPTVNFSTPPDNRCRACVDDQQDARASADTHCWSCAATCTEGLRRCYIQSSGPDICCNFYLEGVCVESCPSGLVPNNTTYDCECPEYMLGNGTVTYTNNQALTSMASLGCNSGYRPASNNGSILTCTTSGWTPTNFTCASITCPQNLPDVVNGVVGYSSAISLVGSNAKYSCDPGYTLKGRNTVRYCQMNRQWNGTAPTCAFIITCPDNLIVVNGMVGYSPADRSVNSTATYSCNDGFSLKGGNSVQHCQDTGQWNGTAPTCTADSESEASATRCQLIITASTIICSLVFLILGMFLGGLIHHCFVRHKDQFNRLTGSSTAPPPPVIYEEVLPDSHTERKNDIELNENVAYGPAKRNDVELNENIAYGPVSK